MSAPGWIFMIGSISFVLGLTAFCFYRVLAGPPAADPLQPPNAVETDSERVRD